jgi:hypothetical protein
MLRGTPCSFSWICSSRKMAAAQILPGRPSDGAFFSPPSPARFRTRRARLFIDNPSKPAHARKSRSFGSENPSQVRDHPSFSLSGGSEQHGRGVSAAAPLTKGITGNRPVPGIRPGRYGFVRGFGLICRGTAHRGESTVFWPARIGFVLQNSPRRLQRRVAAGDSRDLS